jgi:hypothetical protein
MLTHRGGLSPTPRLEERGFNPFPSGTTSVVSDSLRNDAKSRPYRNQGTPPI